MGRAAARGHGAQHHQEHAVERGRRRRGSRDDQERQRHRFTSTCRRSRSSTRIPVGNKSDFLTTSDFLYPFETPHNRTITWDHLLRQVSDWEGTLWGKPDWADRPATNLRSGPRVRETNPALSTSTTTRG
jgi:hypothetical protein